jgi:hypothetical protein
VGRNRSAILSLLAQIQRSKEVFSLAQSMGLLVRKKFLKTVYSFSIKSDSMLVHCTLTPGLNRIFCFIRSSISLAYWVNHIFCFVRDNVSCAATNVNVQAAQ